MRINQYIASCGICSRRNAETFVKDGKVKVNGKLVTSLAFDVNVENDSVTLSGKKITPINNFAYIMMYKPKGCICTTSDEKGRKTIYDYLDEPLKKLRVLPVGRLDYNTEGLLLLTNDGALANKLMQPSSEIPKTYIAKIEGTLENNDLDKLRKGVVIDGIRLKPCQIKELEKDDKFMRLEITIFEGKNREIHKMFETVGKEIVFLKRVQIGNLRLGGLSRGKYRTLSPKEKNYLLML